MSRDDGMDPKPVICKMCACEFWPDPETSSEQDYCQDCADALIDAELLDKEMDDGR